MALKHNVEYGGWCPKGRIAEDGVIDKKYKLRQTKTSDYETRTEKNVTDSDGTLIICRYQPNVGTLLTILLCAKHGKPVLWIRPGRNIKRSDLLKAKEWICNNNIKILNCAGPRHSKDPQIYDIAFDFIEKILETVNSTLF